MIQDKVDQGYSVVDAIEQLKNTDRGGVNQFESMGKM